MADIALLLTYLPIPAMRHDAWFLQDMWQFAYPTKQVCAARMVNTASACSSVAICVFYLLIFFLYSIKTSSDEINYLMSHSLVQNAHFLTIYSVIFSYLSDPVNPPSSVPKETDGLTKRADYISDHKLKKIVCHSKTPKTHDTKVDIVKIIFDIQVKISVFVDSDNKTTSDQTPVSKVSIVREGQTFVSL
ncbi:hypothetical protein CAPTEDRAFT_185464 [Capitella teleta]|uniref:Uncharacterized protein n=1 Tax=Capitella teleta TaxID=283909 RepID=R7VCC9_CAPTE|nr:hypothetical protein CAPTEDRAFT_185464 [Capitella teleta]|eukprot:ELU16503.1 hypothetical protein CAPTEDRAFT_185464 [Capitella teleta]